MSRSQEKQYLSFEEEWKNYLEEFEFQTFQKIKRTRREKLRELAVESSRLEDHARRTSVMASPRLRELSEKKKWMVRDGRYNRALDVAEEISQEKRRLSHYY